MADEFDYTVWDEARDIVRERIGAYGQPGQNWQDIATGWSIIVGAPVTVRQIAWMMAWLKACRDIQTPQRDNTADAANYLLIAQALDAPVICEMSIHGLRCTKPGEHYPGFSFSLCEAHLELLIQGRDSLAR